MIFYVVYLIIVMIVFYMVVGVMNKLVGSYDLRKFGGFY